MNEVTYVPGEPILSLASLHSQLNQDRPVFMEGRLYEAEEIRDCSLRLIEHMMYRGYLRYALKAAQPPPRPDPSESVSVTTKGISNREFFVIISPLMILCGILIVHLIRVLI